MSQNCRTGINTGTEITAGVCLLAVSAYYTFFLYRYALNIPLADDIFDVLLTISRVCDSNNWPEALGTLLQQHNDHHTLSSRLLYLLLYFIEGEANFRSLTFVANAGLIIILGQLYTMTANGANRLLVLLPGCLILFQLRAYGITLWPMASFAYIYVFVYGFTAIYCLGVSKPLHLVAAMLFAFLATFCLASGQLVWLAGLLVLSHGFHADRKTALVYTAVWCFGALLTLSLWHLNLETPNTPANLVALFLQSPIKYAYYYFALVGNVVTEENTAIAALFGFIMLGLLLWLTITSDRAKPPVLEACVWFAALSIAAMVLGRAHISDIEYALSSRYSFPSVLMLASLWILLANRFTFNKPILLTTAFIATIYCISSYIIYSQALQPHVNRRLELFNKRMYRVYGNPLKKTNTITAEAIEKGIYQPPPRPYPNIIIKP